MRTKNIFKAVALAMMLPAMLLTTACSSDDDSIINNENINKQNTAKKGYALPVTVNVTRQGDAATRASFDGSKLNFSAGDKLFVYGSTTAAGSFAGELDYVPASENFSGTIYTENQYNGTADALFTAASAGENLTATLLPNGYDANGSNSFLYVDNKNTDIAYDDRLTVSYSKAFVASETAKATGIEQLSWEQAINNYSSGFALSPGNAILNFTITGLEAVAKDVSLQIQYGIGYTVSGSVTPNASGVATFAVGVPVGANIKEGSNNLTVGSSNFTLPGGTALTDDKIYNITRGTGATVNLSTINADYTAQNGQTLTGTLASDVQISIAAGATVILNNVTINGRNKEVYKWAGITCLGDATIILSGTNTVKGFYEDYPGIQAAAGNTLTINGTGSLTASSNGFGAGIGGGRVLDCGNIEIQGGTVTATGSFMGAGIGSGSGSDGGASCGTITISGGTITATGGSGAAGIGSGTSASCGIITITSGVTHVTATKGEYAPNSIGAGVNGTCGTVSIADPSKVTEN